MHTIRLQVSDRIHTKLLDVLNKLDKKDIQVIEENKDFLKTQQMVIEDYEAYKSGKTEIFSLDQFEKELLSNENL